MVINTGSSSVKFSIFAMGPPGDGSGPQVLVDGELGGIGSAHAVLKVRSSASHGGQSSSSPVTAQTVSEALRQIFQLLRAEPMPAINAAGYRVVHPGPHLDRHQLLTPQVIRELEAVTEFAPLHDPVALQAIHQGMDAFPSVPHVVCFDTVFHRTMPVEASTYPIPASLRGQGLRRYGFHGLSCESIVRQILQAKTPMPHRMVIAHLGSGCSVTALTDGRSVDTTMGLTPTGGVVMGTRPGDLDPGLLLFLLRQQQGSKPDAIAALQDMLNSHCGLVALSGLPNDVKDMRAAASSGNADAALALKVFTRSITKAIGGFCWLLGGLDAVVFAGGIGENDAQTREDVLAGLSGLGVVLDTDRNLPGEYTGRSISPPGSSTAV